MTEVTPRFKTGLIDCGCGCGRQGTPKKNPRDKRGAHVGGCACWLCGGPSAGQLAAAREHLIAADLGGRAIPGSGRHAGRDIATAAVSIEETSARSVVAGARRWWTSKAVRAKRAAVTAAAAVTGTTPALVLSWPSRDGAPAEPQIAVIPYDQFVGLVKSANRAIIDAHADIDQSTTEVPS